MKSASTPGTAAIASSRADRQMPLAVTSGPGTLSAAGDALQMFPAIVPLFWI